ncbi:hypothetical protein [Dyadobacter sp. LHD-138]|nr:hypothetical protein [Dyadobacter sp. LHD-138]MDQ6478120.1 hypothetical protein [Dyadobacter sp. LHD-138]
MDPSTLRLEREEQVFYLLIGILILWVISIVRSEKIREIDHNSSSDSL